MDGRAGLDGRERPDGLGGLCAGCDLNGAGMALDGLRGERDKTSIPATIPGGFGGLCHLLSNALLCFIPFPLIEIIRFSCFLGFAP
jgi:hypothetical protein